MPENPGMHFPGFSGKVITHFYKYNFSCNFETRERSVNHSTSFSHLSVVIVKVMKGLCLSSSASLPDMSSATSCSSVANPVIFKLNEAIIWKKSKQHCTAQVLAQRHENMLLPPGCRVAYIPTFDQKERRIVVVYRHAEGVLRYGASVWKRSHDMDTYKSHLNRGTAVARYVACPVLVADPYGELEIISKLDELETGSLLGWLESIQPLLEAEEKSFFSVLRQLVLKYGVRGNRNDTNFIITDFFPSKDNKLSDDEVNSASFCTVYATCDQSTDRFETAPGLFSPGLPQREESECVADLAKSNHVLKIIEHPNRFGRRRMRPKMIKARKCLKQFVWSLLK